MVLGPAYRPQWAFIRGADNWDVEDFGSALALGRDEAQDYASGLSTSVHLGSWRCGVPSCLPRAGIDYPRSFHELIAWFPEDEACLRFLERVRWGEGSCAASAVSWGVTGGRSAAGCDGVRPVGESSVTVGTIFHGSRLPLQSWFAAIWCVVNQKQGVSTGGDMSVLARRG